MLWRSPACDIPTEAPILEHRWILPVDGTSVAVTQLLPAGVTIAGTRFVVSIPQVAVSRTLGDMCPACIPFNGQTGAAQAFSTTISTTTALPTGVSGANIAAGTVRVDIFNGLGYDVLANGGSATVTLTDGPAGRQLGQVQVTGSLPSGQTTSRTLTIATGSVSSSMVATTVFDSKGGPTTTLNINQAITVTAVPTGVQVSSAQVSVAGKAVSFANVVLDAVEDIDNDVAERVQDGAIILDITNPFLVPVTMRLDIKWAGNTLSRNVAIPATATSTVRLSYTGAELRQFLGQSGVTISGSGTVAASAGTITVTPTQEVGVKAKLDATLQIGG